MSPFARLLLLLLIVLQGCHKDKPPSSRGNVTLFISHEVNSAPVTWDTLLYTSAAGNTYSAVNLTYFISDITFHRTGASFKVDDEFYIDAHDPSTLMQYLGNIPNGDYNSISLTIGLNEEKNITGFFTTLPEMNMEWPVPLGGGYHYMKFEGMYDSLGTGTVRSYNAHTGIGREISGGDTAFNHNFITLAIPNSAVRINSDSWEVRIGMELDEWFKNPNVYDFNDYGEGIMDNQAAQQLLRENGADVFRIKAIERK